MVVKTMNRSTGLAHFAPATLFSTFPFRIDKLGVGCFAK